ncbi:efflux RND transporter periplasmic adaptor subunit [Rheinheimera sp. WS51]|uniref:efflux RND transporter periplasmic adaptor subunit n=1 Tax=Rheinheimera sp. WS51 TaxID=3425886 RepID=UPI003D919BBF
MTTKLKLLVTAVASLVLVACSEPQQGPAQQFTPEVEVISLTTSSVALNTELPGRTIEFRQAEIRPQVSGILQQRLFREGQYVEAGQVLYQIDAATYQAALASAKANLASAKAVQLNAVNKAKRIQGLLDSKVVSQQDYDDANALMMQADAGVASAEAALQSAQINLDYTKIKAPISGKIGRSAVTEGALLTANQAQGLATIRQLDPIYVDLTQSSTELLKLKRQVGADINQEVTVDLLLDDGSKYSQQGRLAFSEVSVDPSTGMVALRAVFDNEQSDLLPGMFVRAILHHGTNDNAILIPQAAISRTPKGAALVMVVNSDNQVEARPVELGQSVNGHWVANSGVAVGERVIISGLQKVRPGAMVRTVNASDNSTNTAAQ